MQPARGAGDGQGGEGGKMTQVSISELFVASAGAMAKLFLLSLVGLVFAKYPSGAPVLNPTAQRSLA